MSNRNEVLFVYEVAIQLADEWHETIYVISYDDATALEIAFDVFKERWINAKCEKLEIWSSMSMYEGNWLCPSDNKPEEDEVFLSPPRSL